MQQFWTHALSLALAASAFGAPSKADVLLSNAEKNECSSSVHLGDIDLMRPPAPPAHQNRGSTLTFVPIETALPRLDVAPRAFHGIVAVELPGPGPADLPLECAPRLLPSADKPVAPQ